jgi:hypothetical protein
MMMGVCVYLCMPACVHACVNIVFVAVYMYIMLCLACYLLMATFVLVYSADLASN